MEGELLPFLFHANWTVGIESKRKLLARSGMFSSAKLSGRALSAR
jgi:hypothetical protein